MRISDWSSDVCSSDLTRRRPRARKDEAAEAPEAVKSEKAAYEVPTADATSAETPAEPVVEKPKRSRRKAAPKTEAEIEPTASTTEADRQSTRLNSSH